MTEEDSFKESLLVYAKAICEFLSTISTADDKPENLLHIYSTDITFPRDDESLLGRINRLPEVQKYKQEIKSHPIIGPQVETLVGIGTSGTLVTIWTVLLAFMTALFDKQGGLTFSKKAFNSVYRMMMNFFKSETLQVQEIVPLENFKLDSDAMVLIDSWKIVKIPEELLSEWWSSASKPYHVGTKSHLWAKYALVKEHRVKRRYGNVDDDEGLSDLEKLIAEIWTIVIALRILKEGKVIQRVRTRKVIGWHLGAPLGGMTWNPNIPETPGRDYELSQNEKSELLDILNVLKIAKEEKSFEVALRRLYDVIERGVRREEDKILDAIIGLESLFLGGVKGELQYRLSLRSSFLLGETKDDRIQIRDDIRYIYKLRNYIVHGYNEEKIQKHLQKRNLHLRQVARIAEGLLRASVKKFLLEISNGKSVREIVAEIDDRILDRVTS